MPTEADAVADTPAARPRFIETAGRHLFTWHHPARPGARRGAAVVLCPPLGYDYMSAYRAWRILAERLAGIGFDAFRFDYEGTGDSAGEPDEAGRIDAWLRDIARVAEEARGLTGSREVALVGLRLGATLALHAAATHGGVDRLVLWSPFRSGRACVRELKAFARLSQQDHVPEDADDPHIHAAGYMVTEATAASLVKLDLAGLATPPAPRILLVDRDDLSVDPELGERLEAMGAVVTRIRPLGTAGMLTDPAVAKLPAHALDAIAGWLGDWRQADGQPPPRPGNADAEDSPASQAEARGVGYRERGVRYGGGGRLFGILTSPDVTSGSAPAIILLNTGAEYHVGPHRLYVPLAREWAARGHVVLRYDLGGIGDSLPPAGAAENIAYPSHALDDLRESIAFVRQEAPGRRVIVSGLCSGGWLAFLAAREGLPVDAIAAVNPPLYLRDGSAGTRRLAEHDEMGRYRRALYDPVKWSKALRGRAAYALFVRLAATTIARSATSALGALFGGPLQRGLARDLAGIAGRGVTSLFVFSRGDGGLDYFDLYGSQVLRRRTARDRISHVIVDEAGHTFRPPRAQRRLRELLVAFVRRISEAPPG